ncbi:MAG: copper amine oxidase [Armatimonadetes bacterium]|nr:copper amine oxidase [Armatimonadota bacterium]
MRVARLCPAMILAVGGSAFASAPGSGDIQLGLYIDRPLTASEIQANYFGAKHEPRVGCYIGAYIDLDSKLTKTYVDDTDKVHKMPEEFEALTGKSHASYFFYLGYGKDIPLDWVTMLGKKNKIVHIALEPNDGLEPVKDDAYLRGLADDMKRTKAPIFLRFGSEMNGAWTEYGKNAKAFREKFRLVSKVMHERAPNVAVVWCPFTMPQSNIASFYPGDDAVDWVGVNIYSVTYFNQDKAQPAMYIHPTEMLDYVYSSFGTKKPFMVGEYGATHYSMAEDKPQVGFAKRVIRGMYQALPRKYPRVKCINYFDSNAIELAHRKNNNYAVTQNEEVLKMYKEVIASPYFLGTTAEKTSDKFSPVDGGPPAEIPEKPMALRDGETVSGVVRLSAYARDRSGAIRLDFSIDGNRVRSSDGWGLDVETRTLPNGPHTFTVEANANGKRLGQISVKVMVRN